MGKKKKNKKQGKVTKGQAQELEQMFQEVEEVMDQFESIKGELNKALKTARMEMDALTE